MTSPWKRRLARGIVAGFASLALALGSVAAQGNAAPTTDDRGRETGTPNHQTMLGDFASPVWLPEEKAGAKQIDIDATLDALEEANANTYAYILSGGAQYGSGGREAVTAAQWAAFPAFADAAAERGIDVYLYMSGPSGSALDTSLPRPEQTSGNLPYRWDYVAWAREIARVATEHPNVGGLIIDDFDTNTTYRNSPWSFVFTPDYVRQMSSAARALDPDFTIHGIVYYPAMDVASAYRGALDGVIFPYRAETGDPGTGDATKARAEGEVYGDLAHCASQFCLQFRGEGAAPNNDTASVSREIAVDASGAHTLTMKVNNDNYLNPCSDGKCFEFSMPGHTPTANGDQVAISQTVAVSGKGTTELSFFLGDSNRRKVSGYHYVEALVDGEVVARRDLSGTEAPGRISVDVTAAVAGKSEVELTLRLRDELGVQNFGVTGWIDDVELTGATVADASFDDRQSGAWQVSRVGEVMNAKYTADGYVLETVVDGEVVATHPIEGYHRWTEISQDLTVALAGRSAATLGLRLRATANAEGTDRTVWVDDLEISGTDVRASSFDDTAWEFQQGEDLRALEVTDHDTLWMVYASRLSSDPRGHQPSADYIEEVQRVGLELMQEGVFDGSLIYVLDKTNPVTSPAGEERGRIGKLYGDYAATDLRRCDVVLRGAQTGGVSVEEGRTCLVGARVPGEITVASGAELVVQSSMVKGAVTATNAGITICDSQLSGSISLTDSHGVRLGATPTLCGGNRVQGSVDITGTSTAFTVAGLGLRGSIACNANTVALDQRGTTSTITGGASGDCAPLAG